jgi:hypothetical protein
MSEDINDIANKFIELCNQPYPTMETPEGTVYLVPIAVMQGHKESFDELSIAANIVMVGIEQLANDEVIKALENFCMLNVDRMGLANTDYVKEYLKLLFATTRREKIL